MPTVANNCSIPTHSLLITIVLAIALNLLLHSINSAPRPQITAQLVWGRASTATKASRTPRPTSRARGTRANQRGPRGCWPPAPRTSWAPRTSSSTTTPRLPRAFRPPTREPEELSTKWSCNWPPAPLSQMWRCAKVCLHMMSYILRWSVQCATQIKVQSYAAPCHSITRIFSQFCLVIVFESRKQNRSAEWERLLFPQPPFCSDYVWNKCWTVKR